MGRVLRALAAVAAITATFVVAAPATADPLPPLVAKACGAVAVNGKSTVVDIWGTTAAKESCSVAKKLVRFAAHGKPPTNNSYNPRKVKLSGVTWSCKDFGTKTTGTGLRNPNPWRYICDNSTHGYVGGGRLLPKSKYKVRKGG